MDEQKIIQLASNAHFLAMQRIYRSIIGFQIQILQESGASREEAIEFMKEAGPGLYVEALDSFEVHKPATDDTAAQPRGETPSQEPSCEPGTNQEERAEGLRSEPESLQTAEVPAEMVSSQEANQPATDVEQGACEPPSLEPMEEAEVTDPPVSEREPEPEPDTAARAESAPGISAESVSEESPSSSSDFVRVTEGDLFPREAGEVPEPEGEPSSKPSAVIGTESGEVQASP